MASSDVVVAQTTFDALRLGKSSQFIVARLLRFWDSKNIKKQGEAAAMFRDLLNSADRTHTVMVVTNINPQNIGGTLFLKSSPTTRFFTDPNLPTITEFTARLISAQEEALPCFHMKKKLTDKQPVSIGELNKFITNSNQQIVEVLQENGWSYVSCTGCSRKLQRSGPSLHCTQCVNPDVTGVVKYRLELLVYDGNDIGTFVVFDKDILKLTRQDAADLLLYEVHGGGCQQLPHGLSELAGKEFVFHIHVTPYNFTSLHRTFTVSEISDDIKPKSSITNEAKFQGEKGDEATASGSTSYMDAVGEEGVDKRPHQ